MLTAAIATGRAAVQSGLRLVYPPGCVLCGERVLTGGGLCPACWREVAFLRDRLLCDACAVPLPGEAGGPEHCDDCLASGRPWQRGRAALAYADGGRRLVLALKHGDRPELAVHAAPWLARAASDLLTPGALIVPVPAHWRRRLARRYDQAAELARALARAAGRECAHRGLIRRRATLPQDRRGLAQRFAALDGAIAPGPEAARLAGRDVVLVDDVMASGATLTAATAAAREAGAARVDVAVLARAVKRP